MVNNNIDKNHEFRKKIERVRETSIMAQQLQFVYLSQSEYDNLGTKVVGRLYFTSDTHRIYKGGDLYAQASFDELLGLTSSSIEKDTATFDTVTASTATFDNLIVTGDVTVSLSEVEFDTLTASSILVNGSSVALEGHVHGTSEITGLESYVQAMVESGVSPIETSVSAMAATMSGITSSSIYKESATFGNLTVTGDITMSLSQAQFGSISASQIQVNGSNVSLEGHTHSSVDITDFTSAVVAAGTSVFASVSHIHDGLSGITSSSIEKDSANFTTVSASTATFDNLIVTGDVTLSLSQVQFGSISASQI